MRNVMENMAENSEKIWKIQNKIVKNMKNTKER